MTEKQSNDKAIRLVSYLEELTKLQSKSVKNLESYHKTLWLKEIPLDSKNCYLKNHSQKEDYDSDIWIEIKKYAEPILEDVPEDCEDWIDNATLYDVTGMPKLRDSIEVEEKVLNPDWSEETSDIAKEISTYKILKLSDHPKISISWDEFVEQKWKAWAALHKKWEEVKSVYTKLFSIHQDQLKLGEEYELVLGIGLLSWSCERGYEVKRHMLVANANLDFEARLGRFIVRPAMDGAKLRIEFDMLDIEDQPTYKSRKSISDMLVSANDDPWDKSAVEPILKSLGNILSDGEGEYFGGLEVNKALDKKKPQISFAPTLVLRKRNTKSLQDILRSMREQIEAGIKIPKEFLDLSECAGSTANEDIDVDVTDPGEINNENIKLGKSTTYFPLPSNEKQNEIVSKAESSTGVLVQGPPGTGKSHTIANLICHLLATGKRVLVTAKTPRALKVLKDKLPETTQPLCINLLGSGIEEQKALESSVVNILAKQDQWSDSEAAEKIKKEEKKLYESEKEQAAIDTTIRKLRESESYEHNLVEGRYSGTAARIAQTLKKEEGLYNWFSDKITYDFKNPFSTEELNRVRKEINKLTPEKKEDLRKVLPTSDKHYPSINDATSLFNRLFELEDKVKGGDDILGTELGRKIKACGDIEVINDLITRVSELRSSVDSIRRRPLPWIEQAIYDMLSDKDTPWKDLHKVLQSHLAGSKEKAIAFETVKIDIAPELDQVKLLADAHVLKSHFDKGGNKGFGFIAPKAVKQGRYIFKKVKIDGLLCESPTQINMLVDFMELKKQVDYCWSLWINKCEKVGGPLFLQIGELEELGEALLKVIDLYDVLEATKEVVRKIQGLGEVCWHDQKAVEDLLTAAQSYTAIFDLEKNEKELSKHVLSIKIFSKNELNVHELVGELAVALESKKLDEYISICGKLDAQRIAVSLFEDINNSLTTLSKHVPEFYKKLVDNPLSETTEDMVLQFDNAWSWAGARSWLEGYISKDELQSLERKSKQTEQRTIKHIETLGTLKAWKFCFERLNDSHRRHLMGWQQAIQKIGKGTGRHMPQNIGELRSPICRSVETLYQRGLCHCIEYMRLLIRNQKFLIL